MLDYPQTDLRRTIEKRVSKFLNSRAVPPSRRHEVERLIQLIVRHINFEELQRGIVHKYAGDIRRGKRPNIFFLQTEVNRALRRVARYIIYHRQLDERSINEFGTQLSVSLRSICRFFDPLAKCWVK